MRKAELLHYDDDSWTWDDLASELCKRYKVADIAELISLIYIHKPAAIRVAGFEKYGKW